MRAVPTDVWIFLAGLVAGSVNAAAGGGTLLGAWLLLSLGGRVFARVVPWLLVASAALIAVQPLVNRWLARHRPEHGYPAATILVPFGVSVFGGWAGVRVARRLPATGLRWFAAGVGIAIGLYLAFRR